jgi:hypothetical protein
MKTTTSTLCLIAVLLGVPAPGDVRTLKFQYPNSSVCIYVVNGAGSQNAWAFAMISPIQPLVIDHHWSSTIMKAGDKITADFNLLGNGRKGGLLQSAKLPDDTGINGPQPLFCVDGAPVSAPVLAPVNGRFK